MRAPGSLSTSWISRGFSPPSASSLCETNSSYEASIPFVRTSCACFSVRLKSAYDLFLSRTLKHAQLVRTKGIDASYELFVSQGLEARGRRKPRLLQAVEGRRGTRIRA